MRTDAAINMMLTFCVQPVRGREVTAVGDATGVAVKYSVGVTISVGVALNVADWVASSVPVGKIVGEDDAAGVSTKIAGEGEALNKSRVRL